jgi:hypothetical protein
MTLALGRARRESVHSAAPSPPMLIRVPQGVVQLSQGGAPKAAAAVVRGGETGGV